jgi:hypothetical protein
MIEEIEYQKLNQILKVQVTTHNEFVKCIEDTPSPLTGVLQKSGFSAKLNIWNSNSASSQSPDTL